MSICGEIEISRKKVIESLERILRTSDLLTKIETTLSETMELHKFAVKSHEDKYRRLIKLLELDDQTIPPGDNMLQEILKDIE